METTTLVPRRWRVGAILVVSCVTVVLAAALFLQLGGGASSKTSTVGAVQTIAPPGKSCTDPSLSPTVAKAEEDPKFTQLSDGLCYNFLGVTNATAGSSGTRGLYTFGYFNGTVVYPCGNAPQELAASQIQTVVTTEGASTVVEAAQFENDSSLLDSNTGCGSNVPVVSVVSARLVEVTIPAVEEVNLTVDARTASVPISELKAVLELSGTNQTIGFVGVVPGHPLLPGRLTSQISIITGPQSFVTGGIYKMMIYGLYLDGTSFGCSVQVALVDG